LVVDATTATDKFKQSVSHRELKFSDIKGKIVASRWSKSAEYVKGEARHAGTMPFQRAIFGFSLNFSTLTKK